MEDIESERFQDPENRFKKYAMDVTKAIIDIFPKDAEIMPNKMGRAKITWGDIKDQKDSMSIQFADASALSKQPSKKMEEVQMLLQQGIIQPDMAASLLQFPDLERATSITSASYDDCQRIIERAAESGDYDFYDIINLQQLYKETQLMILKLDAVDENEKVLNNLSQLLDVITEKIGDVQTASAPPPIPQGPVASPQGPQGSTPQGLTPQIPQGVPQ